MEKPYQTILVAVDGSKQSKAAFDQALKLAQFCEAKLYIAEVVIPPYFTSRAETGGVVLRDMLNEAKSNLNDLAEIANSQGFTDFELISEEGSPRDLIAEGLPNRLGADLIVLGATGRTRTERLILGSVSEYVTRRAKVQVLIVR